MRVFYSFEIHGMLDAEMIFLIDDCPKWWQWWKNHYDEQSKEDVNHTWGCVIASKFGLR